MKILRLLLPGLGLLLLGYLVGTLGLRQILDNLLVMRWWFPAVLALAFLWHVTNSIAWGFAFPPDAFRPRLRTLFMAKLAGEAVNQLTPLANIGGEPLKAFLLKQQFPVSRSLAAVVVNKTAQIFTGLMFTLVGLGLVVAHWDLPQALPLPVKAGLGVLGLLAAAMMAALYIKHRSMFSSLLAVFRAVGLGDFAARQMDSAVRTDASIGRFYGEHKARFALVMFFHALGWLLGACETYVILEALGAGTDFEIAFLITALTVLINSLFFFMPSNIGVLEGGGVFLFLTLGLNPALGLSLAIVKRMRKIIWISIGWLFLTHLGRAASSSVTVHLGADRKSAAGTGDALRNSLTSR